MTPGETCPIKSWKVNRDGSCKVFFMCLISSTTSQRSSFTVWSLHISNIYAQKKGIDKKLVLILRAILISQEVDLWLQAIAMVLRGD